MVVSGRRRTALGIALLLAASVAVVRADDVGGSAGNFLVYGASPRTLAMGKAFCGLADDVEAAYFNPAGLVQLNSQNAKAAHSELYGARMEYLAYGYPTRNAGSFGVTVLNLGSEGIDSRDVYNDVYQPVTYEENAYLFSYGYSLWQWLGVGANLKVISEDLAEYAGVGFGADAGLIFLGPGPLQFGIFDENLVAPTVTLNTRPDNFPQTLRLGAAARFLDGRVAVAADVVKNSSVSDYASFTDVYSGLQPHFGLEFQLVPDVFMQRIGLDQNDISLGAGLQKSWSSWSLRVDYAFLLHQQSQYVLSPTHKLGLNVEFAGYRTWVVGSPRVFSPTPEDKNNLLWMDVKVLSRAKIKRWQILIKNDLGEVVRSFSGWDNPPVRMAWDGLDDAGRLVSDGKYAYDVVLVDTHNQSLEHGGGLTTIKTRGPQGKIEVEKEQ